MRGIAQVRRRPATGLAAGAADRSHRASRAQYGRVARLCQDHRHQRGHRRRPRTRHQTVRRHERRRTAQPVARDARRRPSRPGSEQGQRRPRHMRSASSQHTALPPTNPTTTSHSAPNDAPRRLHRPPEGAAYQQTMEAGTAMALERSSGARPCIGQRGSDGADSANSTHPPAPPPGAATGSAGLQAARETSRPGAARAAGGQRFTRAVALIGECTAADPLASCLR